MICDLWNNRLEQCQESLNRCHHQLEKCYTNQPHQPSSDHQVHSTSAHPNHHHLIRDHCKPIPEEEIEKKMITCLRIGCVV